MNIAGIDRSPDSQNGQSRVAGRGTTSSYSKLSN